MIAPFAQHDRYGAEDQLGTLNRLTGDVVKAAAQEIKTGTRISLNWPLDAQGDLPFFGRQAFHKEIIEKKPRAGKARRGYMLLDQRAQQLHSQR